MYACMYVCKYVYIYVCAYVSVSIRGMLVVEPLYMMLIDIEMLHRAVNDVSVGHKPTRILSH